MKDFTDFDSSTQPSTLVRAANSDIRFNDEGIDFTADGEVINFPADTTFRFFNDIMIFFWIKPNSAADSSTKPIFEKVNSDESNKFTLEVFED